MALWKAPRMTLWKAPRMALWKALRARGVRPGDRIACYLPNVPQTVIALLAAASIGAVWTSCSPDFGWRGVLDRFRQLREQIRGRLRTEYTPRHVPDAIVQVPDIPVTLTGKREVPVRRILSGTPPELAANRSARANPASLDAFAAYARTQPGVPAG